MTVPDGFMADFPAIIRARRRRHRAVSCTSLFIPGKPNRGGGERVAGFRMARQAKNKCRGSTPYLKPGGGGGR